MIKRIYSTFITFLTTYALFMWLLSSSVYAQSTITYPIAELGNCSDVAACRTYCNELENRVACQRFAMAHGLVKPTPTRSISVFSTAQKELGCSTEESCKQLCSLKENFAKCDSFAKKQKLSGGYKANKAALSTSFVQKLKEKLGAVCISYDSCKEFCDKSENHQTCSDIGKQLGLKGGLEKRGPGGCTTEASCKEYCVNPDHFQECSQYPGQRNGQPAKFTGPGGCDSEQACRTYCENNPGICGRAKPTIVSPTRTIESLSQEERAELRKFCKEPTDTLPEQLRNEVAFRKICVGAPENFSEYAEYCKKNPSKCNSDGYKNYCSEFPENCGLTERKNSAVTIIPSVYPTRVITFVQHQLNVSESTSDSQESGSTPTKSPTKSPSPKVSVSPTRTLDQTEYYQQYMNTQLSITPTKTPTKSPTKSPSPTPKVNVSPTWTQDQQAYYEQYVSTHPTITTPTRTPTVEPIASPTRYPSPTRSVTSTSGTSGTSGAGGNTGTNIMVTPQVQGAYVSKSFFQMVYDVLFR